MANQQITRVLHPLSYSESSENLTTVTSIVYFETVVTDLSDQWLNA